MAQTFFGSDEPATDGDDLHQRISASVHQRISASA
jgi:hypothetical protein